MISLVTPKERNLSRLWDSSGSEFKKELNMEYLCARDLINICIKLGIKNFEASCISVGRRRLNFGE